MSLTVANAVTIEKELSLKVETYLSDTGPYRDEGSLEFRKLWAECEKLAKADACAAMSLKAVLKTAAGNEKDAHYYVQNLQAIRGNYFPALASVLINFGRFSQSLESYREIIRPESIQVRDNLELGVANGAYVSYLCALDKVRENMNLSDLKPAQEASLREAVLILHHNQESEEDIAAAMDFAGDIMREHGVVFKGLHHRLRAVSAPPDGGLPYFGVDIEIDADVDTAFDLTCEYTEQLAHSTVKIPMSMVLTFKGSTEIHGK